MELFYLGSNHQKLDDFQGFLDMIQYMAYTLWVYIRFLFTYVQSERVSWTSTNEFPLAYLKHLLLVAMPLKSILEIQLPPSIYNA